MTPRCPRLNGPRQRGRIDQELMLRGSRDFDTLDAYCGFKSTTSVYDPLLAGLRREIAV